MVVLYVNPYNYLDDFLPKYDSLLGLIMDIKKAYKILEGFSEYINEDSEASRFVSEEEQEAINYILEFLDKIV